MPTTPLQSIELLGEPQESSPTAASPARANPRALRILVEQPGMCTASRNCGLRQSADIAKEASRPAKPSAVAAAKKLVERSNEANMTARRANDPTQPT